MPDTASPTLDVVIDAMGGDHAPEHPIAAAVEVARTDGLRIGLVGDEARIRDGLEKHGASQLDNLSIHHASDAIGMDEKPSVAVRKKPDSSLCVAARLVRDGQAKAMVSAGNSGAVMAAGLLIVGRIKGVQRPALGGAWPTLQEPVVIVDMGANTDPSAIQLAQFAILGEAYARAALERQSPRVALLANGSEESKGTELTREAHELLARSELDYRGYCEGRDVFRGELDVIVTDGFTGNVLLKTLEGFVDAIRSMLMAELGGSALAKAGAFLMKPALVSLARKVDYEAVGAAPLLGVEKPCLVAHGGSSVKALAHALRNAHHQAGPLEEASRTAIERHASLGLFGAQT